MEKNMTPTELEKLKAECVKLATDANELQTPQYVILEAVSKVLDHLATTHRLIDLEKVEKLRKYQNEICVSRSAEGHQIEGWNDCLDAVIALVKGEG